MNRRTALRTLAAGTALPLLGARAFAAPPDASASGRVAPKPAKTSDLPPPASHLPPSFVLGIATVTLKSLPLENMLAAVQRLGCDRISLHRAHSPWENAPGRWREIAGQIRAAGVTPLCCGVLYLKNDEPAMRRMLDYVKALEVPLFSCSPEPAALPLLEKLVREYDLRAAIHNHGPEDKSWPSVVGVIAAIAPLDPRIGLCLDVGHCHRSGEDPVAMIHRCRDRLYDVHLKDTLAGAGQKEDVPVEMGRGRLDLPGILAALRATGYRHAAWLEYEKDPNDPVPGLAESLGYLRGLLRGMAPV